MMQRACFCGCGGLEVPTFSIPAGVRDSFLPLEITFPEGTAVPPAYLPFQVSGGSSQPAASDSFVAANASVGVAAVTADSIVFAPQSGPTADFQMASPASLDVHATVSLGDTFVWVSQAAALI